MVASSLVPGPILAPFAHLGLTAALACLILARAAITHLILASATVTHLILAAAIPHLGLTTTPCLGLTAVAHLRLTPGPRLILASATIPHLVLSGLAGAIARLALSTRAAIHSARATRAAIVSSHSAWVLTTSSA